jgi:putative oxidoreductase
MSNAIFRLVKTNDSITVTVLRLALGVVIFAHGAQKAFGWFGGYGISGTMGFLTHQLGIPAIFAALAIAAEFLGSLGLIFGALTRVAALGVGAVMIGAVLTVHAKVGFFMNWGGQQAGEGYEYHILVLAIVAVLAVLGGGPFSIDRALARSSR